MIENKKQLGQKQEEKKEEQLFRLPKNIRQVGQGEQNFVVYIEDYVMSFVHYIGKCSTEQMRMAVLLGESRIWEEKRCVFIYGAVIVEKVDFEAKGCFSKEIWEKIYREIEENFKNKQIVGWMVTKAGINMEPSKQLEKLHLENFSGKDKVLLLYDTLEREEKVFIYQEKRFNELEGYCIYYDKNQDMQEYMLKKKGNVEREQVSDHAVQEMKKRIGEMETRQKKQSRKKRVGINIAIIAGVAICGVALQQKGIQKQFSKTIETFKEENENVSMEMYTPTVTKKLETEKQPNTVETEEQIDQTETAENEKKGVSDSNTTETMENIYNGAQYYTIQPGDTLVSICMKEFSSLEKMDEIMRLNQIQDKNKIVAGQRLKLYE